jgi:hypothetical protein
MLRRSRAQPPTRALVGLLLTILLVGCATEAPPKRPAVAVDRRPVQLEYRTFPPGRPPLHVGVPFTEEFGLCDTGFACQSQIGYQFPRFSSGPATAEINRVEITVSLHIIIWTAEGTKADVLAHEETHRAISEHYYADAERIARAAAQKLLRRKFTISSAKNHEAEAGDALRPLEGEMYADYMRETRERCQVAQERFDDIVDHGRNPVDNQVAMARALADEETKWRGAKR